MRPAACSDCRRALPPRDAIRFLSAADNRSPRARPPLRPNALAASEVFMIDIILTAKQNDGGVVPFEARGVGAIGCKAPRHRWHLRQRRQCRICNLQNPKGRGGFESHPLRNPHLRRHGSGRLLTCPVTLERDDNGTILVSFPDLPEAHTFGADESDALERAKDALATVIDAYIKDRRDTRNDPCLEVGADRVRVCRDGQAARRGRRRCREQTARRQPPWARPGQAKESSPLNAEPIQDEAPPVIP